MVKVLRSDIKIKANPERVIPLLLVSSKKRIKALVTRITNMEEVAVDKSIKEVLHEFEHRHIDFKETLLDNFRIIANKVVVPQTLSLSRKQLIGAFFTKEYSIESAALFNPSITAHPDQNGYKNENIRFIMSLRATGEGHISSVVFRTGMVSNNGKIQIDEVSGKMAVAKKNKDSVYTKDFIKDRAKFNDKINPLIFNHLPEEFSKEEAFEIIADVKSNKLFKLNGTKKALKSIFDTNYELTFDKSVALNRRVIFPSSKAESNGIEDVRFVKFSENNESNYIGTYTAYNGKDIYVQIIKTKDFNSFEIRSLHGNAASDKGMALFPEKINGKFAMISRQGGSSISIMYSNDICFWNEHKIIQRPEREWEMTQMGNSGSPIKTEHGWVLLTHAVGALRKYVLSATLLDLENPEIVLATLSEPLLSPNTSEREGYVPNVVYTCGSLLHGNNLIIPYAMSDSATSFVTVDFKTLLNKLLINIKK